MPLQSLENYFDRLERLLKIEAEAEKMAALRELQRSTPTQAEAGGYTLIGLTIRDEGYGMGGRILLNLGKRNQTIQLPWTRLRAGTPVIMTEEGMNSSEQEAGWRGVISRVERDRIQVAFPEMPETVSDRPILRLDRSSDELARQRQIQAMHSARNARSSRTVNLRDVLLGVREPEFEHQEKHAGTNLSLNESQNEAVQFALSAKDLAVIHGPPGTGKTTTLAELVRRLVARGERVLVCAPSNLAVDNLLERLIADGLPALRLGHPARVMPELRTHTLDEMVENHPELRLAQRLARQASELRQKAGKHTRAAPERGERQSMRQEARQLQAESRQIEALVVQRLLDKARVICATLTGLDANVLGALRFDCCVVDEAGQSTEPAVWIPLQYAERLILAGDPFQLPPTVISPDAAGQGFNISMLERLMSVFGDRIARRLDIQYRMHQDIMRFSSQEFYEDSQRADPSVAAHLLSDLPGVQANPMTCTPVSWIDTAGAGYAESQEADGESRLNLEEGRLLVQKIQDLFAAGLSPENLAVITPYAAQARLLRQMLSAFPDLEIDTVDGFQGREKEAVLVSLVRSNPEGEIGFLEDVRRMNVALTRARRKLLVVGDSATIGGHPFYQRLMMYFEGIGAYHSVWEIGE